MEDLVEIVEGKTKLLVPKDSLNVNAPPKQPAFFNPRAKLSRDFSIIAYSAFLQNFKGPKTFLDCLAGIGARSLRVANELEIVEKVFVNDVNPKALELGMKSAELNNVTKCEFSENEACRFLSLHSKRENRGAVVDIDPFGSPSRYLDCGIRATCHGGLLSVTATDLPVLHGLYQAACQRRYYGIPVRTEYGNEIALRLILGCIHLVAGRLDVKVVPLFVQHNMHYYRIYVKVLVRTDPEDNMGYILHCKSCGHRKVQKEQGYSCEVCGKKTESAGPLWIGEIYDSVFVNAMLSKLEKFVVSKSCEKTLLKCQQEIGMPATYFTLDEIARKMQAAPISLEKSIEKLQKAGFKAEPTSLNPSGLKTNARIDEVLRLLQN
jgi:tRNA (guanine26-N2/guanine27-N2)-dimethyltransferase